MKKQRQDEARNLQAAWERGVERAAEDNGTVTQTDAEMLNDAAGLHVQSGVQGGWGGTGTCGDLCSTFPGVC